MPNLALSSTLKWSAGALGVAAAAYGAYAGQAWLRYGHPAAPRGDETDALLDRFIPHYDVVERHRIAVAAPAAIAFETACHQDLNALPVVRAIFAARQLLLGGTPEEEAGRPSGLLELTESLGWGVLAREPEREIVVGAVTRPWEANVVFRPLPPQDFAAFNEPGYVKIVWTIRADDIGAAGCTLRTETRAVATDVFARARFRRYWAKFSAGIVLIRWMSLAQAKRDAERWAGRSSPPPRERRLATSR
jgi:hypothetical protein